MINSDTLSVPSDLPRPDLREIPRPNWIEIDLDALKRNLALIRSKIPSGTKVLLPVKADAYGHGSLALSWAAVHAGIDFFGVAHLFEGILLRQYGIKTPVLVLGPCVPEDFPYLVEFGLTPSLSHPDTARAFSEYLVSRGLSHRFHLKIDTGMHRFGVAADDLATIREMLALPGIEAEGMYTHMATADMPGHASTDVQIARFSQLADTLAAEGKRPPICHLANSAATLLHGDKLHFDMVRPGVALYGYNPMGIHPCEWPLSPVMALRSTIRTIHEVPAGEGVSYGHWWVAERPTKVAAVAIGYGDGYLRGEYNKGMVLIRGVACPILGRVCMDATMVDVSALPDVRIGETVDCIDGNLDSRISMETLASEHRTISYEITCRVARRLYRLYRWKGRTMRWDDLRNELGVPDFVEYPERKTVGP